MEEKIDYRIKKSSVKNFDDDAQLAWDVIVPLWDIIPRSKKGLKMLEQVTQGQRALFTLDWCQKIIRNDGLKDFFSSSVGIFVNEALEGFKLIGAKVYADVLKESMLIFPDNKAPLTTSRRKKIIKLIPQDERNRFFDSLEDKFFKYIGSKEYDLERYRANYVRSNPKDFFTD